MGVYCLIASCVVVNFMHMSTSHFAGRKMIVVTG